MKPRTASRIIADHLFRRDLTTNYMSLRRTAGVALRLLTIADARFTRRLAEDYALYSLGSVRPVSDQTKERARAAVAWILRAQKAAADGGVSLGYFPCERTRGWQPSYPETTGYTISSLLEFARRFDDRDVAGRALRMARWEVEMQMESGAVQAGVTSPPEKSVPAAFNTGMVLDGWSAAYRSTGDTPFLDAGRRAADFLLGDLSEDGYFSTHGPLVTPGRIKTYTCLCAWPLYRFGEDVDDDRYTKAAVRVAEAALKQQQANGWFANNCLGRPEAPLVHTIGYTLQGILEVGVLAGRKQFVEAVARGTDPLITRMSTNGFLFGRFYSDWEPAVFSSCLTGSAQVAVVCYRLYQETRQAHYRAAADRLVNHLKALQVLNTPDEAINGALSGSFPLMGGYMPAGYPNWGTKYFLDALLLQAQLSDA